MPGSGRGAGTRAPPWGDTCRRLATLQRPPSRGEGAPHAGRGRGTRRAEWRVWEARRTRDEGLWEEEASRGTWGNKTGREGSPCADPERPCGGETRAAPAGGPREGYGAGPPPGGRPKGPEPQFARLPRAGTAGPSGRGPYAGPRVAGPVRRVSQQECSVAESKGPASPGGCQGPEPRGPRGRARWQEEAVSWDAWHVWDSGKVAKKCPHRDQGLGMMTGTSPHRPSPPGILSSVTQGGPFWTGSCGYQAAVPLLGWGQHGQEY